MDYIRPMMDFSSLEELKSAIATDISTSHDTLAEKKFAAYAKHDFFQPADDWFRLSYLVLLICL